MDASLPKLLLTSRFRLRELPVRSVAELQLPNYWVHTLITALSRETQVYHQHPGDAFINRAASIGRFGPDQFEIWSTIVSSPPSSFLKSLDYVKVLKVNLTELLLTVFS